MRFGVPLARVRPDLWDEVVDAAEALGFESLWSSDHLVFPTQMAGSPHDPAVRVREVTAPPVVDHSAVAAPSPATTSCWP